MRGKLVFYYVLVVNVKYAAADILEDSIGLPGLDLAMCCFLCSGGGLFGLAQF